MTKDDYVSMSKFMFMQICQQAEMTIHLSQFKDQSESAVNKSGVKSGPVGNMTPIRSNVRSKASGLQMNPSPAGNPLFETSKAKASSRSKSPMKSPTRSKNDVLTLDKDVNEMQLTFESFRDCLNQFSCLRQIARCIHTEMGLESEVNVTKAFAAMKLNTGASASEMPGVMVKANSLPSQGEVHGRT